MKVGETWLCPRCRQDWLERLPNQWSCSNCGFELTAIKGGGNIPDEAA